MSEHDNRSTRIAHLSGDRLALARALASRAPRGETIPVADRDRDLPASFAQRRLWFLDQLEPGNPAYNCPIAVRLSGPLDVAALTDSLSSIVARHEVLRTTFDVDEEQEVVQVIWPPAPVALPVTDLSGLPPAEREERVREAIAKDTYQPFDLSHGPVLRAELLRMGPGEHVFLYDIHHIANDGWSVGVFFTELAENYNARVRGRAPRLSALPVQYADYAAWQRERMTDAVLEEQPPRAVRRPAAAARAVGRRWHGPPRPAARPADRAARARPPARRFAVHSPAGRPGCAAGVICALVGVSPGAGGALVQGRSPASRACAVSPAPSRGFVHGSPAAALTFVIGVRAARS